MVPKKSFLEIFFLPQDFFSWHQNFFLAVKKSFLTQGKKSGKEKNCFDSQENIFLALEIIVLGELYCYETFIKEKPVGLEKERGKCALSELRYRTRKIH